MGKQQKTNTTQKQLIPTKYQDALSIVFILAVVIIFFWGPISGGGFIDFDNISSWSFKPYLEQANREGRFPQWIPLIFSGMPAYASLLITGSRIWDIIAQIYINISVLFGQIFGSDVARVIFSYILYGLGIYWFLVEKKFHRTAAVFAAFAAIFSTYVITWVMIGHNTKPVVVSMFPYLFLFAEKLKEKFRFTTLALMIFAIAIMFIGNHLQMIFYGSLALLIYLLYDLIVRIIKKNAPIATLRTSVLVLLAYILAFAMSADRYLSTLEYAPYSVRGSLPIVKAENNPAAKIKSDYEYATMWSYHPKELFTFLVPSYFGFGIRDYQGSKVSTYWGTKESEDSPPYMGIIVLALAFLGLWYFRKDTFVQALIIISVVGLFLSFGKHLPILYNLFYHYFPSFSKFRAPSMALVLVHFAIPLLSAYGLLALNKIQNDKNAKKVVTWIVVIPLVFLFIAFIFSAFFKSTYTAAVGNSSYIREIAQRFGNDVAFGLQEFIWKNTINDWYINSIFLVATGILAALYINKKIKYISLFSIIGILTTIDLIRVDSQRMDYSERGDIKDFFLQRKDIYDFIKQDNSIYRIADFSANPANVTAYYLVENINGYHAAKLRVYQDLMDVANIGGAEGSTSQVYNPFLWKLLNVKYLVFNQPIQGMNPIYQGRNFAAFVYFNGDYLPRAFFVKQAVKERPLQILYHLKNGDFDPTDTVFVEETIAENISPPDSLSTVEILEKKDEYIKIRANASGNHILFLSEVYYPPAWKAYIDAQETKIYKANYAFRAVVVPKGSHIIEFKYHSPKFETGKTISLVANIITLLLFAIGIFFGIKREKKIKI